MGQNLFLRIAPKYFWTWPLLSVEKVACLDFRTSIFVSNNEQTWSAVARRRRYWFLNYTSTWGSNELLKLLTWFVNNAREIVQILRINKICKLLQALGKLSNSRCSSYSSSSSSSNSCRKGVKETPTLKVKNDFLCFKKILELKFPS